MLLGAVVAVAHLILPATIPLLLVVLICLSDLVGARITDIAAQAFQAMDQFGYTANFSLLPYLMRMISAALVFALWHRATAMTWGWFYLGSTAVSCAIAVAVTNWKLGMPKLELARIPPELKEGFYFGAGLSAQTIYNDIDKTMLASLSTLDATGIYAAAYRVIDVAFTPVKSVLYAAYSNFFRNGKHGIEAGYSYAKRLLPRMIGYSVLAFAGLYLLAPLFPLVIGKDFARTVEALRCGWQLPLLKDHSLFPADSLSGAATRELRSWPGICGIEPVGLNFWLIPLYSWRGAAWSSIACDGLLAVVMYCILVSVKSKEARLSTNSPRNTYEAAAHIRKNLHRRLNAILNQRIFQKAVAQSDVAGQTSPVPEDRIGELLVCLILVPLLIVHSKKIFHALRHSGWIIALCSLAIASAAWSSDPRLTLRRGILLTAITMFAVYVASCFEWDEQLDLFGWLSVIAVVGSAFMAIFVPYMEYRTTYTPAQ